jgi:glucan phosphoethanolaminetransferase (alkaline phosphatase superfamily)
MLSLLVLIVVFIGIIAIEVPVLVKKQLWGELAVFSFLMIIGIVLSVAETMDINLPNPTNLTESLFAPISDAVNRLIE